MTLQQRIELLVLLGEYIKNNEPEWQIVKEKANRLNPWFVPEFIEMSSANICECFLQRDGLEKWTEHYKVPETNIQPATVGVVMAGNVPMVGFHDMLCIFITGHKQLIKLSSKDDVLIKHLVEKMVLWNAETQSLIAFAENLKDCDAYIATGSNNSSRYFEYYFGKYPHIIRKNRTSVAVLDGTETFEELELLADDIQTYFGLGCRNVTKLLVPKDYNFEPLLMALNKYDHYGNFHKYKNNYDYHLALLMMSNKYYMTNETILLTEKDELFTPVSQVNYTYYSETDPISKLKDDSCIQCIIGHGVLPFGQSQKPTLQDYADGVDTMWFAMSL